jgi:Ca-activated chloride channel family protein
VTESVGYGLSLDLVFDLGSPVDVECPSHAVMVTEEAGKSRVRFAQKDVPLDRDVVVLAVARAVASGAASAPIATAVAHRSNEPGATGTVALTIIPDLGVAEKAAGRKGSGQEVVFLLDRSGSMGGASMPEAGTALRLCLRQLREGDRFAILAFDDTIEAFAAGLVPFTQATLERADAWLAGVEARGGTELLAPMTEAAKLSPTGVVVLLTDGEVGNEDEILRAFMAARTSTRVYSFGIGTNVSDALLQSLAEQTGGAVESIHPGERVDEKVVAQFARATAVRVTDVTIKTRGIDLAELAPSEPRPLVDGEPYTLFGTYTEPGRGAVEIRGKLGGETFYLDIPVDLADHADRPMIPKLWAQARIRDLEHAVVTGRRAEAMKDRIVKLATAHGVSSRYTSFVVVEKRTGDRRSAVQPEARVVPVNAPAGWSLFQQQRRSSSTLAGAVSASIPPMKAAPARASGGVRMMMSRVLGRAPGGPPPAPAPMAAMPAPAQARASMGGGGAPTGAPPAAPSGFAPRPGAGAPRAPTHQPTHPSDVASAVFQKQAASGLWEEGGQDAVTSTVDALLAILRHGVTASDPVYGAQIKKAVEALVRELAALRAGRDPKLVELAFGLAWLLAGRRTRLEVAEAARVAGFAFAGGTEATMRARVDTLAATA